MFLVNSRLGLVSATLDAFEVNSNTSQVPLIPKLRGYFAEFLHHDYLDRLGILYLSTCVGLGYGRLTTRSRSFSRQHRITHTTPNGAVPSRLSHTSHGFANATAYALSPRQPSRGMGYLPASLRSLPTTGSGHRLNHPTTPKGDTDGLACLVSPASARALLRRYQNINWLSIDYACRPRLRSRLTQGRLA